jgi:NADP-dependent 3-hydroxy acid dehydrogenase YdfG
MSTTKFEPHPQRRPAVIAGASSGIGAATAELLGAQGFPVALGARRVEKIDELAAKINEAGGEAVALELDVTKPDSVAQFVKAAEAALGPIEVAVSGAGDLAAGKTHEMDPETFAAQVDVHLLGAERLYRAIVPGMVSRTRGDFVFIGSDVVKVPRMRLGPYVAAKAGIEAMVQALQAEMEGTGVRVSTVRPGQVLTGMGMNFDPETVGPLLDDWRKWGHIRHSNFLSPEDLAAAVSAVVNTPRGSHLSMVEVQPEAPIASPVPKSTDEENK